MTRSWVVAGALLLGGLTFGLWRSATPFGGPWAYDWLAHNGGRYAIAARNFERHGFLATRFVADLSVGSAPSNLYVHHPPLTSVVIALARKHLTFLWPDEPFAPEDRARLVFWLLSGISICLVFLIGRQLYDPLTGGWAALLAGFVPLTSFYATHVEVQGSLVLSCILLSYWCFLRGRLALSLFAFALGALADWPAYYLAAILPLVAWRTGKWDRRLLLFPAVALVLFGLHALQVAWAADRSSGPLTRAFSHRSMIFFTTLFSDPREALGVVARALGNLELMLPWPVLVLATVGLVAAWRARAAETLGLALVGVLHEVIFPAGAALHDYWCFALAPGACLLAALGITTLAKWIPRWRVGALVAAALAVAALGVSARRAGHLFAGTASGMDDYVLGTLVNQHTPPSARVLTNGPYNRVDRAGTNRLEFSYYADRDVSGAITSVPELERIRRETGGDWFLLGSAKLWQNLARNASDLAGYLEAHATLVAQDHEAVLYRFASADGSTTTR
jgi:4-amino-4-deoxy-L-arabinose transferase-like glycosyltransferase